jgi:hypothetical protein
MQKLCCASGVCVVAAVFTSGVCVVTVVMIVPDGASSFTSAIITPTAMNTSSHDGAFTTSMCT